MGQFLHHYETENAFSVAYNGSDYREPWVSLTEDQTVGSHVDYNKGPLIERIWERYGNQNPYPALVAVVDGGYSADNLFMLGTRAQVTAGTVANVSIYDNFVVKQFTGQEQGLKFVGPYELKDSDLVSTADSIALVFLWSDATPLDVTPNYEGCEPCSLDPCSTLQVRLQESQWGQQPGWYEQGNWCYASGNSGTGFCALINGTKYVYFMYSD